MAKLSAGLLPFRLTKDKELELFIVHPGGPFWAKKDSNSWSIPKGEYQEGEDPLLAAQREFSEEVGLETPTGEKVYLGEVKQPSGKKISIWAIESPDLQDGEVNSNNFEMEWPPKSGQMQRFPEVDKSLWAKLGTVRDKLVKGQLEFIDILINKLGYKESKSNEVKDSGQAQASLF